MHFDAAQEATKIENLAHKRLDTVTGSAEGESASKNLTTEWASLSQKERDQVATAIHTKYFNNDCDTLPVPSAITDGNGHCVALTFKAALLDVKSGPKAIDLYTSSSSKSGISAEISTRERMQNNDFLPELAQKEAKTIKTLAEDCAKAPADKADQANKKLCDQWSKLTPEQRSQVATVFKEEETSSKDALLPIVTEMNAAGECTGLRITTQTWKGNSGPTTLYLHEAPITKGGETVELSSKHGWNGTYSSDYAEYHSP